MAIVGHQIGKEIGALFPGEEITELNLKIRFDEAVTLEVKKLATEQQARGLMEIVKRYTLTEDRRPRCDVCGQPTWNVVQDVQQVKPRPSDEWMQMVAKGNRRAGCEQHPVHSRTYHIDGRITEQHLGREVDVTTDAN